MGIILVLGLYFGRSPRIQNILTSSQLEEFRNEGILKVGRLLTEDELTEVTQELMKRVENRPEGVRSEDIVNWHFNDSYILNLTKHPIFMSAASQLLNSPKLRLFSSRILCKLPGESIEVPWHQDSNYWPLQPLKAVTLWMALDDITKENGAMDMYPFSVLPETKGKNLKTTHGEEIGTNFNIQLDPSSLPPVSLSQKMTMKRGEAQFHDAYILHHSDENNSEKRRCAWIARYVPDYVIIPPNSWSKIWHSDYELMRIN